MAVMNPVFVEAADSLDSVLHEKLSAVLSNPDPDTQDQAFTWYPIAHEYAQELAYEFNLSVVQTAGIISALSPQRDWEMNKRMAWDYLCYRGVLYFSVQLAKCDWIRLSPRSVTDVLKILRGPKTQEFFLSILDPEDNNSVCIDSHMARYAGLHPDQLTYKYGHDQPVFVRYKNIIRDYAHEAGWLPHDLQAYVWIDQKGLDA